MSLKNKLKLKTNLKDKIKKENAPKKDTRFLNYYDLKDGEKMTILFIPCAETGELYNKYKVHGPKLGIKGLKSIRCADEANQDDCPACQQAFALLNEGREDGNDYETYKEEAKKFFPSDKTVAQCVVLESPVDISESPDSNEVKLISLTYAMEEKIRESILEGLVDEDDICLRPFVIKNNMQGKFNSYKNSYFHPKQVTDEVLEAFDDEDLNVTPYDLTSDDIIPAEVSSDEMQEWLDNAIKKYNEQNGTDDDDEKEEKSSAKKESLQDRLAKKKKQEEKEEDEKEEDEDTPSDEQDEEEPEQKEDDKPKSSGSSLRDRLKKARK